MLDLTILLLTLVIMHFICGMHILCASRKSVQLGLKQRLYDKSAQIYSTL